MKRLLCPLAIIILLTPLCTVSAQTTFRWTGTAGDSDWNNSGNWEAGAVPNGDGDQSEFSETVAGPLEIFLEGTDPRGFMYFGDLHVTAGVAGNLNFSAPRDSILNAVILERGSEDSKVVITSVRESAAGRQFNDLRVSQGASDPLEWAVGTGRELVIDANLTNPGGRSRQIQKVGEGVVDFRGDRIGRPTDIDENISVSFVVSEGTLAFSRGEPQTVALVSSELEYRTTRLTVASGATLEMDIGETADRLEYVRASGRDMTEPFQTDWLEVQDGAILKLNGLQGFQPNQWYTLFRNVTPPTGTFMVEGLPPNMQAEFRNHEYVPGFNDLQVRVVPR